MHSCVDTFLLDYVVFGHIFFVRTFLLDHVVVLAPDLISLLRGLCFILICLLVTQN